MHRSSDSRDGTTQDLLHLCSALERFFLYNPHDDAPSIYLVNYLELLLQSARTRICVLAEPMQNKIYNRESIQEVICLSTFKTCEFYLKFLSQLADGINKDRETILHEECVILSGKTGKLYILIARISMQTGDISIGRQHNHEAYYRLTSFFRKLNEDSSHCGLNISHAMYDCLINLRKRHGWLLPFSPYQHHTAPTPTNHLPIQTDMNQQVLKFLKVLNHWIVQTYDSLQAMTLAEAIDPANDSQSMGFGNVFFFIRANKVDDNHDCATKTNFFDIKLVFPANQKNQISQYYHQNKYHTCQWYQDDGECAVSGMGHCIAKPYWDTDSTVKDATRQHYEPLWEKAEIVVSSDLSRAAAPFLSSSIVFSRRHEQAFTSGEKGRVNGLDERDKVTACITHRMLPHKARYAENPEDRIPQVMFVPVYAGSGVVLVVSTVVNTQLPQNASTYLSEWRRSFRFADYVLGRLSDRLQESLRRLYVNEAVDIMQERFIQSDMFKQDHPSETRLEEYHEDELIKTVQQEFDCLARALPYRKLLLAKCPQSVIKRQGQGECFITAWRGIWRVRLVENPYWQMAGKKDWFELDYVVKKFQSCMQRVTARREEDLQDFFAFLRWYYTKFGGHPPPSVPKDWRTYAHQQGWSVNTYDASSPKPNGDDTG